MGKLERPSRKRFVTIYGVAALLIALALLGSISVSGPVELMAAKKAKLQNEFNQVQTAELNYYTEHSVYPVAKDNATLIRMLVSDSPRHIAFISIKASDQNAKGELLDPWGTPIEMSVTDDGRFHVRSAGPDKIFGTADDIANE